MLLIPLSATNPDRGSKSIAPGDSPGWTIHTPSEPWRGSINYRPGCQVIAYFDNNEFLFNPSRIGFFWAHYPELALGAIHIQALQACKNSFPELFINFT